MKRLLYILICLFLFVPQAYAKNWTFSAHDGTTGGTTGKLDNIDQCNANGAGYDLQDKDGAIVWDQAGGRFLFYIYDGDSETAESDPSVIAPDYCDEPGAAGAGRWILSGIFAQNLAATTYDSDGSVTDAELLFINTLSSNVQDQINAISTPNEDTIEGYIFDSDAETITGNWEVQDDVHFSFGNDDDASWAWDAAAVRLELRNVSDTPIFWFDLANSSLGVAAVASPENSFYDSDAAGAERTDEYAGGIGANFDTTTEDATDSTTSIYYMDNSVKTTGLTIGGATPIANFQGLPVTTTGLITGGVKSIVDADGGDPDDYCYGGVWFASDAGEIDLPAVAVGMELTIENHTDGDVHIDPDGSEQIKLNGATALTGGYRIIGTDIGDSCVLRYYSAGVWSAYCYGYEDAGS